MEPTQSQGMPLNSGNSDTGHKKQLLQKLMSNLLSKPGRSMHEVINGVKEALAAYKNYAKEWDNLTQMAQSHTPDLGMGGSRSDIQRILQGVQERKSQGSSSENAGEMQQVPMEQALSAPAGGIEQPSSYRMPAPVERLGMWGY